MHTHTYTYTLSLTHTHTHTHPLPPPHTHTPPTHTGVSSMFIYAKTAAGGALYQALPSFTRKALHAAVGKLKLKKTIKLQTYKIYRASYFVRKQNAEFLVNFNFNDPSMLSLSFNYFIISIGMVGVQVALGITTLLLYVPIPLAATHQVKIELD